MAYSGRNVVISIINRTQDSWGLTYPTPSLIAYNTTAMMHLKTSLDCHTVITEVCINSLSRLYRVLSHLTLDA